MFVEFSMSLFVNSKFIFLKLSISSDITAAAPPRPSPHPEIIEVLLPAMAACTVHHSLFTADHKVIDIAEREGHSCDSNRF